LKKGVQREFFLNEMNDFAKEKGYQALTVLNTVIFPTVNVVVSAAWHALNAFNTGNNISSSLSLEIMLYLSCQRQIKQVLDQFGVGQVVKEFIVIAVHGKNEEELEELDRFMAKNWNGTIASDLIEPPTNDRGKRIAKLHGMDHFNEKSLLEKISVFSMENTTTS
jgi:tRNA threonylcarbamoyladenosine modification (KEOPS) complex Cgi121 subunit